MTSRRPIRLPARKWLIAGSVLIVLFLTYLWVGRVLAPRLIRTDAMRWAHERPGVTLDIGPINVDPLHWTVTIRDIRLDHHGRRLATLKRLFIGLSPVSLLGRAYHFTVLELDAPHLAVRVRRDGSVNLRALQAPAGRTGSAAAPRFRIDELRIDNGRITLTDRRRDPVAHVTLTPITLRLRHFRSWTRAGGRFALQAYFGPDAHLAWWGRVSMAPLASSGEIALADARLGALMHFMPPNRFVPSGVGRIDLMAHYGFAEHAHGASLSVSNLSVLVRALRLESSPDLHGLMRIDRLTAHGGALRLAGGTGSASLSALTLTGIRLRGTAAARGQTVSLQRLTLARTRLDPHQHRVTVGTLAVRGLHVPLRREPDGRLALWRFLAHSSSIRRPSAPLGRSPTSPWAVQLGHLAVHESTLSVLDRSVKPAAHFNVHVYALLARGLSTNLTHAVPFTLRAGLAPRAYLALDARVSPARASATVWLSLAHLPLQPFISYLPLARTAELHSGSVDARGFAQFTDRRLAHLHGRADVRNLDVLDRATGTDILRWRRLSVREVQYRPQHLVIGRARLTAPAGLIAILPNRTLNLAALIPAHRAGDTAAGRAPPNAPVEAATPRPVTLLKRLNIVDGSIRFADDSIQPHFHAPIEALNGSLSNVSSAKNSIAHITLTGHVINRYSPVSVRGSFNPYGLGRDTDIRASFADIELPIFNPYSDRYAGYAIARGKLSAQFRYRIDNRRLDADHRIEVAQLQWGGPSASAHRVGWPIRFATALLKNRDGLIRINLPVTGSLSNPDFHIASIVWTMLVHLLEKAALSPFHLIGTLFAGAQKAQYIVFQPGSAALAHGAAVSLSALAHALTARPALQVDIPAGPAGAADAVALENARIDQWILGHVHGIHPGGLATVSLAQRLRTLRQLYRTQFGTPPRVPSAPEHRAPSGPSRAPVDTPRQRDRAQIHWLREQLRAQFRPDTAVLAALGLSRAENVQNALLSDAKINPKRVFITTERAGELWQGRIRLKLHLR